MSRKIPDSESVELSHGAVYLLEGHVDKAALTDAIAMSIRITDVLDRTERPVSRIWLARGQRRLV